MNNDLISHDVSNAKYIDVIPAFEDFDERNEDCDECPFYDNGCSGDFDKRCLSADVLELLKRGRDLEMDAEPVRHGKWIHCKGKSNLWYCSECGEQINYNPNRKTYKPVKKPVQEVNKRCRNCGAKMDGGNE